MTDRWEYLSYALGVWSGRKYSRTDKVVDGSRERWRPNTIVRDALVQFVKATKRFQPNARTENGSEGQASRSRP